MTRVLVAVEENVGVPVGAYLLFTFLGVMSARNGQWLTAAGLILAAVVFGLGSVRAKPAA